MDTDSNIDSNTDTPTDDTLRMEPSSDTQAPCAGSSITGLQQTKLYLSMDVVGECVYVPLYGDIVYAENELVQYRRGIGANLPDSTHCLACSADGRFLGVGHSGGFSVWCASSLTCFSEWLQETVEITSIQITRMSEAAYLLGTIDDMGVARVFALYSERIHLTSVINAMEDVNKRSICLAFDISEGGDYGVASLSCAGAAWLEVYHFPRGTWLTKMAQAQAQTEFPDLEVRWSPVAPIITIKPPRTPAARTADGLTDMLQMRDFLTHCLAVDAHISDVEHKEQPVDADAVTSTETNGSPRLKAVQIQSVHFVSSWNPFLDAARFTFSCLVLSFLVTAKQTLRKSRVKPSLIPAGLPVAVCVWWSGSRSLSQYLLQKASKNKPDVEPAPDVLWPHEKEIVCSAVSNCTRYIAVGLDDGLVSVWDRKFGFPLSIVLMPASDSAFLRMHFINNRPAFADDSTTPYTEKIHLLILCKSGTMHTVATGRGIQPCTALLTERPKDSGAVPTVIVSVPSLQGLSLVVQRNGQMFLQDTINKTALCFFVVPSTHLMATHCNPVFAFNAQENTLFIKGDSYCSGSESTEEENECRLFIFELQECDVTKCYIAAPQHEAPSPVSLQESCDLYLQQRALSVDERNKALKQTWRQLEETSALVQMGQSRAAASC